MKVHIEKTATVGGRKKAQNLVNQQFGRSKNLCYSDNLKVETGFAI